MRAIDELYNFVKPYKRNIVLSLFLLAASAGLEALRFLLIIPLFDKVLISQPLPFKTGMEQFAFLQVILDLMPGGIVWQVSLILVTLTLLKGIFIYCSDYLMGRVGQNVLTDLRNILFNHVIGQSMGFFASNSTGRLMSKMGNDVEQIQEAVSTVMAELFRESVVLAAMGVVVFVVDWKLALLTLLIAPPAFGLTYLLGKRSRIASLKGRQDTATLNDQLQQSLTGMRIIKAFGMESHESRHYKKTTLHLFRSNMRAMAVFFLSSPLLEFIGAVAFVPILFYAHRNITGSELTLGMFGSGLFALFRMYDPIRKLSRIHIRIQRSMAAASRISDLLGTHHEIQDRPDALDLEGILDSIEFRNVFFKYEDQSGKKEVLRDIHLKVKKNEIVAIVGSSGAGKSTLVDLIPRFYDPTSGSILIDGRDIRDYRQNSLRRQIAIVTQETFLFNDTVCNNIAYGNKNASMEQIIEAGRAAFAHDFIMGFPLQYQTPIGERGQRLSGGERQRISIARALLKNAPILILDEATSSLDSESEKLVQKALINLIRDRTTLIIAHRLSTVRNVDRIIVLENGRIVESGTHKSLMELQGRYSRFFRLQTESDAAADV
ncbi:MAG: ABC transporter ATP-binding protein [Acidobacteria bacterium]|nr:ABC transporter ATP-binding protein [Acidobacteriota bacterium]